MLITVAILSLLAPFLPFRKSRDDQYDPSNDGSQYGDRQTHFVGTRLEAEFDLVVALRNGHAPEDIVHPAIIGLLAIHKGFPALGIIDLAEHGKLVGLRRKGIIDRIVTVSDQLNARRGIG